MANLGVSAEHYLTRTYRPDCDYVEGVIEERNAGQKDHGKAQRNLLIWFWTHFREALSALPGQRIRIHASRYRVPDVCVVERPEPDEQVFTKPPLIVVEVLASEDSLMRLQQRIDDYLAMGVPNVWVLDRALRRCWTATSQGLIESTDGHLRTTDGVVDLPLVDLFQD